MVVDGDVWERDTLHIRNQISCFVVNLLESQNVRTRRLLALSAILLVSSAQAARQLKPGFNLFSKSQEVELGRDAARQVEHQVRVVHDSELTAYVSALGRRLAAHSPAPEYPYTFKIVADKRINAFALPGGPIYVNSGTIAAAENEAQLAGVIAHEIAHVALRHSTNQASKAMAWQIPLSVVGGALGSGSLAGQLARLGIGFGVNSAFLKYSRDAERDADIAGARILARAGYDPIEMARFFENLRQRGREGTQFFSDHPSPGNRIRYVQEETRQLPRRGYTSSSTNYRHIRDRARQIQS